MKPLIFLSIIIVIFSSCMTASAPKTGMEKPVRQEELFEYNGKLFYEMNTSVGLLNKPQSKLWHFKGEWYGILPGDVAQNHVGTHLVHIGKKAESVNILQEIFPYPGIADVFSAGNTVYIVFDSYESARFEGDRYYAELDYNEDQNKYNLKDGFPVIIGSNKGDNFVEGSTITVDGNGVIWIAYDLSPGGADGAQSDGSVAVVHSTTEDHKTFSEPEIIHSGAISDDIAKILAWNNKIGIFISDQARWEFRFIWRDDSDNLDSWSNIEIAEQSEGNSDDHINYAYNAQKKELYFATKDSFDNVELYKRSSEGTWNVTENFIDGSRAMILFDASGNNLFGFSYQDVWSGNTEDFLFNYLSVGNWGQSKDMTSTQQPCDSTTGLVIAKKHFKKLELLYIPLEGTPLMEVDVVDWTPRKN